MPDRIENRADLQVRLAKILSSGPLYSTFVYEGQGAHSNPAINSNRRSGALPAKFRMFCDDEHCKQQTWWETENTIVLFGLQFINERNYGCRNCGRNVAHYYFIWQERKENSIFIKVGQYPELEERIPDSLSAALAGPDLKMYKNAVRMRNFNLGLAAVAYMRRVVEDKMNDMLEILHEAALAHNAPADILNRHEEMKREKRFAVKVDYAGALLPASLRPQGMPNPMAVLHDLASEGLHARSDDECVKIFDRCRVTFEYVFGKLRVETEDAKNYVKAMVEMTTGRARFAKSVEEETP